VKTWEATTQELKRNFMNEWKKIGHVPENTPDKIWKDSKAHVTTIFDRFHALKNEGS